MPHLTCDPFDIFFKVPVSTDLNLPKKPVRFPTQDADSHVMAVCKGEKYLRERYYGNPGGQGRVKEEAPTTLVAGKVKFSEDWEYDHQG